MSIEEDITLLEQVPTLGVLGRAALRILAIGAENKYVHADELLFAAGDSADAAFVVQDGSFLLRSYAREAEEPEFIVGRGSLLGEFSLLTDTTRQMTATACEPSNVLRISRSLFLKMLEGFPDAAFQLRSYLVSRTDRTARDLADVRDIFGREPGQK